MRSIVFRLFHRHLFLCICLLSFCHGIQAAPIQLGIDQLFQQNDYVSLLRSKRIGLISNHTAINYQYQTTFEVLKKEAAKGGFTLQALFAPEHGFSGDQYAGESIEDKKHIDGIPIYSLHGSTRRPTADMLKNIDLLIYDIQDIGSRSYTYISTLFYAMEEAAKKRIPVVVLDRPNPLNGMTVDGPMMEESWRSFVGYINVPYCHGMTVGELARYFNAEYHVGCQLTVVPMKGWKRKMTFADTGLPWVPTSPNIPEASTAFYYPTTGIIGELSLVNIGVGYTLPFKVIGAPWIQADVFAQHLNEQKFPGVYFYPFHYRPFFGRFANENCHGVLIWITDPAHYLPVSTQYLILGTLKTLYSKQFLAGIKQSQNSIKQFNQVNGTDAVLKVLMEDKYIIWKLRELHHQEREKFQIRRAFYLLYSQ